MPGTYLAANVGGDAECLGLRMLCQQIVQAAKQVLIAVTGPPQPVLTKRKPTARGT